MTAHRLPNRAVALLNDVRDLCLASSVAPPRLDVGLLGAAIEDAVRPLVAVAPAGTLDA